MKSHAIQDVERLLKTEMDDMEEFYREFGESTPSGPGPEQPVSGRMPGETGDPETAGSLPISQPRESWNDLLRNSTRFMKSGDFFDYIENIVDQDVKEETHTKEPEVQSRSNEAFHQRSVSGTNLDMSQARNLNVEMNVQSTFIDKANKPSPKRAPPMNGNERKGRHKMSQIKEENEERMTEMSDEPKMKGHVNEEPSWRKDHPFGKSMDERVISSKKKTFDEMLEEAFPGFKAPVSAKEMASYIFNFSLTGNMFYNGKVLQVSSTTP